MRWTYIYIYDTGQLYHHVLVQYYYACGALINGRTPVLRNDSKSLVFIITFTDIL